jgi:ABC-type transporter Mla subunit MlaD
MPERRRNGDGGVLVEFQPMSPDEVQRTVQFLLHQQALFDERIEKLSAKTEQVADGLIGLTAIVGHVVESVSQIADGQKRTDEQLRATDAKLGELSDHINTVESHLNVVIQMFERHLRDDHGIRPS